MMRYAHFDVNRLLVAAEQAVERGGQAVLWPGHPLSCCLSLAHDGKAWARAGKALSCDEQDVLVFAA